MDGRHVRHDLAWPVVAFLLAALGWRAANTSLAIALAAFAPATIYAAVVAILDRREPVPMILRIAAFLWGAVIAASIASTLNGVLQAGAAQLHAGAAVTALIPQLGAPVVEELAKGMGLVVLVIVWPQRAAVARRGVVDGALIGLGFAMSENLLYLTMATLQGGYAGLLRGTYLRATVYGANHAVFTATTGAALGYARTMTSRRRAAIVLLVGFAAAVALHVLWNTVVSDAIGRMLCAAPAADAACRNPPPPWMLYVTVPLMVTLFIGPCVAALLAIAARTRGGCPAEV